MVDTIETSLWKSFEERNLCRMMQFVEVFPDTQIVSQVATQLSWSHFIELLPIKINTAVQMKDAGIKFKTNGVW